MVGGSERYARELAKALARVGELDYLAFVPTVAPDVAGRIAAMTLAAARPRTIRRRLGVDRLDAIHFPLSVMLPRVERPAAATTVHDLQHELYPQFFPRAELVYRRVVYGWTLRRSRIVIAISEHARETLLERHGLAPERVRTIHLGLDHERFRPDGRARQPFLLYPANRWPHKNHGRLTEAFALVRLERPELRLVLTGSGHDVVSGQR